MTMPSSPEEPLFFDRSGQPIDLARYAAPTSATASSALERVRIVRPGRCWPAGSRVRLTGPRLTLAALAALSGVRVSMGQ